MHTAHHNASRGRDPARRTSPILAVVFAAIASSATLFSVPASASHDAKALLGLNVILGAQSHARPHCTDRSHYQNGHHQDRLHDHNDRRRGDNHRRHISERRARNIAARQHGLRVDTAYRRGGTWIIVGNRASANPYRHGYGSGGHQSDHANIQLVLDAYSGHLIRRERHDRRHDRRNDRRNHRDNRWYDDGHDRRNDRRRNGQGAIH